MTTCIAVYLGSAIVALIVTPLVIRVAKRVGAVDRPGVRTIHERPIPRIGGVAIFVAAMSLIVAVLWVDNAIGDAFRANRLQMMTLLTSATFIFLVGLVDDLRGLPARVKFGVEVLAAVALCAAGIRIKSIGLTGDFSLPLGVAGYLLTVLWVVGVTNAVNLSDGLDGLAAGIGAIACGVIAVLAIHRDSAIMAILALALAGSLSGFLVFNFNPAKIFMGDCGSLFLGYVIAASSVMCLTTSSALVGLALPALALGIPIFDTLFSMLRRFLERRSLFAPDRSHFHHRLLDMGLRQRHAVILIYLLTIVFTGLGLFVMVCRDLGALVVFGCILFMLVLVFRVVGSVRLSETLTGLREKYVLNQCYRQEREAFEYLELRFDQACDEGQWWDVICETARRMEFAWVCLKTTRPDGRIEQEIWRAPLPKPDMSRLVMVTIPLPPSNGDLQREFEIAIWANGSLEAANRRACLFGRLMDEHGHRPTRMAGAAT
ncbi:MAG: MraY family glycosyltransferase [Planctomycetota bacterium]|nr:MraY family glycosyltransferase [Planctomycetota bacterium]